jgi:hypothetical protein
VIVVVAALFALAAPSAIGATVVNGDFETGTLSGWHVVRHTANEDPGSWFAYTGTEAPVSGEFPPPEPGIGTVQAPPQGEYAAITDEGNPGDYILYQDVALEPFDAHRLSMTLYYRSFASIMVPTPDTLSWSGGKTEEELEQEEEEIEGPAELPPNQQYRVDVMKPTAPVDSLSPSDILATVFATKVGDSESMGPTQFSVDLTPFAGQTVRLRFANVDNEYFFNAGVDAVSITSAPLPAPPPPAPSNTFTIGKPKLNKKNGTAKLPVTVPGPGALRLVWMPLRHYRAAATAARRQPPISVKEGSATATAAGTVNLSVLPTKAGRKLLREDHKLRVKVAISFTPTGGTPSAQTRTLTLRLKAKRTHKPR